MNSIVLSVDDLREQYLREMALVRQTYERTGDGTAAIRRRSAVVDRILIEMWRRALAGLGISALLVGAAGWVGIEVARRRINDTLTDTTGDIRRIADVMVGQARGSLHHWLDLTLAAGGALVVLGVLVALLGSLRKR